MKILIAVDGSDYSRKAIEFIAARQALIGSNPDIEVLNVQSAYAKKKLDLLVLGSHGYGAFKAVVMGSVATRVTAHCTVPLLLVRD